MTKLSFSVLQSRSFRLLLITRMFTQMALQAQAVIVGWQVYSLTKDVFLLGLTGLVEAIPAIGCAFFAGHIVDNTSPKKVYALCTGAMALNMLMLLLLAGGYIPLSEHALLIAIFVGVFISGVERSFNRPASSSMLPLIVERSSMPAAAWQTSTFQIAVIGGPALAGLIYGGYGVHSAWLLPVFLMISAFFMSLFIKISPRLEQAAKREPVWTSIKAGWTFIWNHHVLLPVMALDMFSVLFGGAVAMLPAYADQILHVGAEGLGALRAAPAIGAVIMAVILSVQPLRYLSAKRLLWVFAGFGICMIGFGLSKIFWLSMVFLAVSGALDSINMVIRGTLMQLLTPNNMLGRVSSINSMFVSSSNEIGAFESGTAARLMGLVPSVVFGGVCTLLIVGMTAFLAPKFRETIVDAHDQKT
ncbi:MAG TPA: MFS transporter [Alphaproteobacteria bacterium]